MAQPLPVTPPDSSERDDELFAAFVASGMAPDHAHRVSRAVEDLVARVVSQVLHVFEARIDARFDAILHEIRADRVAAAADREAIRREREADLAARKREREADLAARKREREADLAAGKRERDADRLIHEGLLREIRTVRWMVGLLGALMIALAVRMIFA